MHEGPGPADPLDTSFSVRDEHLACDDIASATGRWEPSEPERGWLLGTALLESGRKQPFSPRLGVSRLPRRSPAGLS
jgi:hypothetical protein